MLENIDLDVDIATLKSQLLDLAEKAYDAEQDHLAESARELINKSEETLNMQIAERQDLLDTYLDALSDNDENETRKPQEILDELNSTIRLPIRLNNEQMRRLTSSPKSLRDEIEDQIHSILTGLTVTRLIAAFERRLEEGLSLKPSQYQNADWQSISGDMLQELDVLFEKNRDRLFGSQGQISRELDTVFEKLGHQTVNEDLVVQLLGYISQGSRMVFDQKTHRQVWQRTTRLRYLFLAAKYLVDRESPAVTADVLEHLEDARKAMIALWGSSEWARIRQTNASLSESFVGKYSAELGEEKVQELIAKPLTEWDDDSQAVAKEILGSSVMNEIYRQLLLSVISELWVDYLTRVEALRVSIGLEAYAQRDPLVQYKGRASELFGELLRDIRSGTISRMFTYRPRVMTNTNTDGQSTTGVPQPEIVSLPEGEAAQPDNSGGKKRRHRH